MVSRCCAISVFAGVMFAFIGASTGQESITDTSPSAFIPQTHYKFEPVPEGTTVVHDFIIQNHGKATLVIEKVKTSWGCTAASYSEQILPGREGKITIKVDTSGNGGRNLKKTITVFTNEKSTPQRSLFISGKVERIFTMTPKKINLRGTVGETITLSAMIVPEEKYRFNVTKAKVMKGKDIDFTWEEYKRDKGNAYILTVNNLKKEKGRYTDTIILDTDSRIQPQIRIGVYGNILEPK